MQLWRSKNSKKSIWGSWGAATEDSEKTLLPTILLVLPRGNLKESCERMKTTGFSLSLGWWHYYVSVSYTQIKD